jgi:hypothetical protein
MKYESQIIASGSGSIGGCTFSRNRGGQYIRRRSLPVNPGSTFQNIVTAALGTLVANWVNVLTQDQRDLWDAWADAVNPNGTGENAYIAANVMRLQAGFATIPNAPTPQSGADLTPPTVSQPDVSDDDVDISFNNADEWATAVGGHLFIFISRPTNASRNFFKGPYRYAGTIDGAVVPPTSPSTLIGLPFSFAADQRVHFQFRASTADGRISPVSRTNAIAVA